MAEKISEQLIINEIKMPTKIYIGDTKYINNTEFNENTFSKNFKCKSKWVGEADLRKVELKTNNSIESADYLTIIYAPTKKFLDLYKNKSIFDYQKFKNTEVLTTSKEGSIKINDNSLNTTLKNAGLFADVLEVFNKTNKLEGLIINIYLGDNSFDSLKNKIKDLL